MITSDSEYFLLCELITMPDRILAQQIELLIWATSRTPQEPILEKFLDLLGESDSPENFWERCRDYVNSFPTSWKMNFEHGSISVKGQRIGQFKYQWPNVTVIKES